ncbi:hypothetical protein JQ543_13330 [Bradyrhizobium diazoefficiens]|nr:hypothetical protein [Bradyrhizobium diazoefficiens]MBR0848730.1 hypothetical protein [Bradyrhizobium diazoefficiens]
MPDDKGKPRVTQSSNSDSVPDDPGKVNPPGSTAPFRLPWEGGLSQDPLKDIAKTLGGQAELAKVAHLAGEPSPEMKKAIEGVLSGVGGRTTSTNDTFVGRFLTTLGGGFLTGSLTVAGATALKSDPPNWYAISALVVGFWIAGGFLIAAGLKWPKWKPNHEQFAQTLAAISNSKLAWSILLLLIGTAPAAVVELLTSGSSNAIYTKSQLDAAVSEALDPLQKALDAAIKQRNAAVSAEQSASLQRSTQAPAYPQAFGTTCALNLTSVASDFWSRSSRGTAVLITAAPGNQSLQRNLLGTFEIGTRNVLDLRPEGGKILIDGPNNSLDMDAPRLPSSDQNGIIVHGEDPEETLKINWSNYFVVRRTSKVPEGLAAYYKVPSIVWIEIGPGSPWVNPTSCSAG